jgi:hypothetical protein
VGSSPASNALSNNRESLRDFVVLGALAFAATALAFYWHTQWAEPFPRDATTLVVGRDFLNFWMYGHAAFAADPGRYYEPHLYNHVLQAMLGKDYPIQTWSYPPTIMLVAVPFGLLGYRAALLVWTALGGGLLYLAMRRQTPRNAVILGAFISPAAVFCLMSGQNAFVVTAMLIAVFAMIERRPLCAGALIGLLTLKPQLGLLLPVMLIASGQWRAFIAAAATAIALALLTAALFGPQVWIEYLHIGLPAQNHVLSDTYILAARLMPTVFMNVHLAGVSYGVAMALQLCVSILAAAVVAWAFRCHRDADPHVLLALFLACATAATPYLMSYDTLPLVCAALLLLARAPLDALGRRLVQMIFWLPFIQLVLGTWHIPGAGLIAPVFVLYLARRLSRRANSVSFEYAAA